jgi:hypothetical protein
MYAKLNEGAVVVYPYHIHTLRLENPNTSFPNNIEVDFDALSEFNVVRVFPTAQPGYNPMTKKVVEGTPVAKEGRWEQVWEVVDLSPEELVAKVVEFKASVVYKVQERLDAFARTRNYDNILSAATYATSKVARFAAEGQYAVEARDGTWAALYQLMAEVDAGTRTPPTSYEEIEVELPTLAWPV